MTQIESNGALITALNRCHGANFVLLVDEYFYEKCTYPRRVVFIENAMNQFHWLFGGEGEKNSPDEGQNDVFEGATRRDQ